MGILYAISILAFCALLWAALSIARLIRGAKAPSIEEVAPPAPRKATPGERPFLEPERVAPPRNPRPFEFFDPREFQVHPTQNRPPQQPVVSQPTSQAMPPMPPRPVPQPATQELQTHDLPIHGVRRPPRPAPKTPVSDRLDWAYYNKDLGNLKDPEPHNHARNNPRPDIKRA